MREAPMTVLHLTFQGDGAGSTQSIFNLGEVQARTGHRVLVGCRAESVLAGLAAAAGLEVVPLDFARMRSLVSGLAAAFAREHVDVVNSHATRDRRALSWLRWRRRLGPAFVVTRRTMPLTSALELAAVGRTADRTIAVSGAVARALARRGHPTDRLRVVPNGLDLARVDAPVPPQDLEAARAALGEIGDRRVAAIVSRRKDQEVVLRALPEVGPPLLLACVGIEAEAGLAALAARLPSRHRAVFIPFTTRPLAFYHLASAALLPSRIEGFSQALLEAMALGLPVVASDAGGNPDLVTPGRTGWLVPPLDVAAWARTLNQCLGDPEAAARVGGAGRALVRREFTLERTAERTAVVYREAMARRTRLLRGDASM
jgi:glycosyltransferase involved in cell wall biosynthesis